MQHHLGLHHQKFPKAGKLSGARNGKSGESALLTSFSNRISRQSFYRFFVDLSTGKSTWEKPTAPALPTYSKPLEGPPSGSYIGGGGAGGRPLIPGEKGSTLYSNNPYNTTTTNDLSADARLAQELQAEEDARARSSAPNQNYQASPSFQQSAQQQQGLVPQDLPPRETKRSSGLSGLLSKLTGKSGGVGHGGHQQAGYGYQQQQQQGYAGYPPGHGGGAYSSGGGYGGRVGYGYQSGGMMPPRRRPGGGAGMGMAGAGALGLGAGLVGGAMLADGGDGGGDGGDYGGGDGGGDYGGDYGGGDGGGDYGGGDGGGGDGGGGDGGG